MALIDVPSGLALYALNNWRLRTMTPTPGPGLDGRQQWMFRENRVWMNKYSVERAWDDQNEGAYLAFLDDLKGAVNSFLLPIYNRTPNYLDAAELWREMGYTEAQIAEGRTYYDDGSRFSDRSGFALPDGADPIFGADAPVGATLVTLLGAVGELLWIGAGFSVDGFYYRVAANTAGAVRINPPLRQAITAGTVALVGVPQIRVKLENDEAVKAAHDISRLSAPYSLSVIEAFDR